MEALVCTKLGEPSSYNPSSQSSADENSQPLQIQTLKIPALETPTSVLVRVTATSLNYANYLQILGKYQDRPSLPFVPGSDYSGVVHAVGSGVNAFSVGDRVCSFASVGSFAQFVVADQSHLIHVPAGCDLVAAAALPVAFGTAHIALTRRAGLKSGQVLLVIGAAGGVGLAAVQIGIIFGAIVICVARGSKKVWFLKSLGVAHVVNSGEENVIMSIKSFLETKNLKGIDVLFDPVGGKVAKESFKLLDWGAQILVIGFASGEIPIIPTNIALVKNWTVHGLYWGSYRIHQPGVIEASIAVLLSWMEKRLITVHVSHTFSLSEAGPAFSALKDREVIGKLVFVIDGKGKLKSAL